MNLKKLVLASKHNIFGEAAEQILEIIDNTFTIGTFTLIPNWDVSDNTLIFKSLMYVFLQECILHRIQYLTEQLEKAEKLIGKAASQTVYPKRNHSIAANKDFVFITGGSHPEDGKSFEIFILTENRVFRGPDLELNTHSHASFIKVSLVPL